MCRLKFAYSSHHCLKKWKEEAIKPNIKVDDDDEDN